MKTITQLLTEQKQKYDMTVTEELHFIQGCIKMHEETTKDYQKLFNNPKEFKRN